MRIGSVVVTYNRLEKLKKCLASYDEQIYQPQFLIVVNNCSTDGTYDFLEKWKEDKSTGAYKKIIIHVPTNLGGSGGFVSGMKIALNLDIDWIWLADDDAYLNASCYKNMMDYYNNLSYEKALETVSLCSMVINKNGLSILHRRRLQKNWLSAKEIPLREEDYDEFGVPIDFFSFVGTMIKKDVVSSIGFPREDYFILFDDTEYSLRVREKGEITCIPSATIFHDSQENIINRNSWKNYYMFRNKLYTYKYYFTKRYFIAEYIRTIFMIFQHYNTIFSWKQWFCALRDLHAGKMGKREEYLP